MIYLTGDTHGELEISKLSKKSLSSKGINPKEGDYVIIAGDFGLIWNSQATSSERYWLKWLDDKPFKTLFVDGNHENFYRLNGYPVERWHGGDVHCISKKVLHLMRGSIFEIAGKTIFVFGGAASHDRAWRTRGASWWPQEMPSEDELAHAVNALASYENKVDYIITHCAPSLIQARLSFSYERDRLTEFFEYLRETVSFTTWYFGHYHVDRSFKDGFVALYDNVTLLGK